MDIRKIIREELKKVMEADYYDRYPDFFDPLYNPSVAYFPPKGYHKYGEMVKEDSLEEDYPQSFDMDVFKNLSSFNARIKYCEEHLQRISSGSGRIAYKVDDEKVLKLAKNQKGIAQNEVEYSQGQYRDLEDIVARVFDAHPDYLWIEMELARKMSKGDFKRITGFSFDDYRKAMVNYGVDVGMGGRKYEFPQELWEEMWEDEFVYDMFNYMPNYDVPPGDLMRTSSYGIVKRNGEDKVVLIDYGFNKEIFDTYYSFAEGVMNEAMAQISNIPEDVILIHGKRGVDDFLILYNYENNKILGMIAFKIVKGDWEISVVAAEKGYGPLMYEFVMMYVSPRGVMPARSGDIEDTSRDVWIKFFNRDDIKKKPVHSGQFSSPFHQFFYDEKGEFEVDKMMNIFNQRYYKPPTSEFKGLLKKGEEAANERGLDMEDVIERAMNYFSANYEG